MNEIEYHRYTVGRILAYLINKGLARVNLHETDATNIMIERRGDEEEVQTAFLDCLHWMRDEGLIRVASIDEYGGGYSVLGMQLTAAGLALIRQGTDDPDIGPSIEERVTRAKDGELDARDYSKIGDFVGGVLGGITKALGSG